MSTGILSPARRARAARRQMPSTRALVEGKVATGMKEVDEEGRDPGDKDKDMDTLLGNKDKVQPPAVSQRGIVLAAIFYSACAATLLVFNKLAVRAVPVVIAGFPFVAAPWRSCRAGQKWRDCQELDVQSGSTTC